MTMKQRTHIAGDTETRVIYGVCAQGYFSVTADQFERGWFASGGCQHELVLGIWPDLAPLVALHLSDADTGLPMHAETNGWYWLSGAIGGAGERYHGGNSDSKNSPEECLRIFTEHCRISKGDAEHIADSVREAGHRGRFVWRAWCDGMRLRWPTEARAARATFGI